MNRSADSGEWMPSVFRRESRQQTAVSGSDFVAGGKGDFSSESFPGKGLH
ncbi:MAG: hypothetical protein ACYDDS_06060 [Candidatus Sulfotelmatobacter sp.]